MSDQDTKLWLFTAIAAGSVLKQTVLAWVSSRGKNPEFEYVGKISELYVFPVKSCRGLKVQSAKCTRLGLFYGGVGDRHWVVRTADGGYLTQRQAPKMALIGTSLHGNMIHLDAPGKETLKLPINPTVDRSWVKKVTVKVDTIDCLDCGDTVGQWLDDFLGKSGLRLVFSPPEFEKRDASNAQRGWDHKAQKGDITAFHDYCGYMLMTNSSLKDLNTRLREPASMLRFRGNFIVDGSSPYDEDNWAEVRVGKATMRNIDACTRCVLTTVDPSTGQKSKDEEPLTTLRTYRLKQGYGQKPLLGVHLALDTEDIISVGDDVYAKRH